MKKYGVAIVGCGWVAGEHIKAYENDPRSQVTALFDFNENQMKRAIEEYNLKSSTYSDFDKMLEQDDIDIVVVCTPHNAHTEYVVKAANAGKHVLVEKPAALTPEEVRQQVEAVEKNKVKSLVGFVLHWNPLLMTIDSLIDQKAFGDIFMVEVDYLHRIWMDTEEKWYASSEQGGTTILVGGCHAVDALRWFARSEVTEVSAYHTTTDNPVQYPGTISLNMKFANDRVGRSATTFDAQMPYRFNICIYGTEGSLRNDMIFAPKLFPGQNDFMKIPCVLPDSGDVAHHPFQGEAAHLLDCIEQDKRPLPDLVDAEKTHAVCFAADLSAQQGRPVSVSDMKII